jgi:hypothetical protein
MVVRLTAEVVRLTAELVHKRSNRTVQQQDAVRWVQAPMIILAASLDVVVSQAALA